MLGFRPLASAPRARAKALPYAYGQAGGVSAGAYAMSGKAAALLDGNTIQPTKGTFTLTGKDATLTAQLAARVLVADPGAFVLSGKTTGLFFGRRAILSAGAFAMSGKASSLFRGSRLVASSGPYVLSGKAATLRNTRLIQPMAGAYALSGKSVSLLKGKTIQPTRGIYALSGKQLTGLAALRIGAVSGVYVLTGVGIVKRHSFMAESVAFEMVGMPAALRKAWSGQLRALFFDAVAPNVPVFELLLPSMIFADAVQSVQPILVAGCPGSSAVSLTVRVHEYH